MCLRTTRSYGLLIRFTCKLLVGGFVSPFLLRGERRKMKKSLTIGTILIVALFIGSYLFAQEEVIRKTTKTSGDFVRERTYYINGKEVAKQIWNKEENRFEIIGKIPDGLVKEYGKNGQLFWEGNYKENKLNGLSKDYAGKNRSLTFEANYKDDKLNGISKFYLYDGKLSSASNYKDGELENRREYYKSGQLKVETNYKSGKRNGMSIYFYENGQLIAEVNYKNDKQDGITKIYWESGEIAYIDTYKNGEKIYRKAYDRKGKLEFDQDYPYTLDKKEK